VTTLGRTLADLSTLRHLVRRASDLRPDVAARLRSAAKLALFDTQPGSDGTWSVTSERDPRTRYVVAPTSPTAPRCSCVYARAHAEDDDDQAICKHQLAVSLYTLLADETLA
jgi:hypothetical protein